MFILLMAWLIIPLDFWVIKLVLGGMCCSIYLVQRLRSIKSWRFMLGAYLLSSLWYMFFQSGITGSKTERYYSLFEMLGVAVPVLLAAILDAKKVISTFKLFAIFSSLITIFQCVTGRDPSGTLINNSVNGCLLALVLSLMEVRSVWFWIVALGAIASKSSMAVGVAFIVLLLSASKTAWLALIPLSSLGLWLAGTSSTGRVGLWRLILSKWVESPVNALIGYGVGSFQTAAALLQEKTGYMIYPMTVNGVRGFMGYFAYAHSEYVDVLWNMGTLGLILFIGCLLLTAIRAHGSRYFIAVIAFMACMAGNSILHWAPHALLFACVVKEVMQKSPHEA